jgi:hypothetical protein
MPGDAAASEDAMSSSKCIALPAAAGADQGEAVLAGSSAPAATSTQDAVKRSRMTVNKGASGSQPIDSVQREQLRQKCVKRLEKAAEDLYKLGGAVCTSVVVWISTDATTSNKIIAYPSQSAIHRTLLDTRTLQVYTAQCAAERARRPTVAAPAYPADRKLLSSSVADDTSLPMVEALLQANASKHAGNVKHVNDLWDVKGRRWGVGKQATTPEWWPTRAADYQLAEWQSLSLQAIMSCAATRRKVLNAAEAHLGSKALLQLCERKPLAVPVSAAGLKEVPAASCIAAAAAAQQLLVPGFAGSNQSGVTGTASVAGTLLIHTTNVVTVYD